MRFGIVFRGAILAAALWGVLPVPATQATSRDFLDETVVSQPFKVREIGIELGLESRVDAESRIQGWYTTELEFGLHPRVLLEAAGLYAARGHGLEFGGWRAGARYRLLDAPRFPADVSLAVEYEVETTVRKHPATERLLVPRVAVSRTWNGFAGTLNLGVTSRLAPSDATDFAYGAGLRYPEGSDLKVGLEYSREPLDNSTRITPQMWIAFPGEARLRLGGVIGTGPHPYWFVARAILETEF